MPPETLKTDLKRLLDRRGRIYATYNDHSQTGQILDPPVFKNLVKAMRKALRLPKKCEDALRESLFEFAGGELTNELYDRMSVKLASGYDDIKRGNSILPSNSPPTEGIWLPLEVSEMRFDAVKRGRAYVRMSLMVLAGAMAGRTFRQSMPAKAMSTFFATHLGWPKWGPRPVHSELVLMLFTGLVISDQRYGLQVDEYKCTATQLQHNKEIRGERAKPCLQHFRFQCKTCPQGYSVCPRGTHRYSWVPRHCKQCKAERAIFDPSDPNATMCLLCQSKRARAVWAQERRGVV